MKGDAWRAWRGSDGFPPDYVQNILEEGRKAEVIVGSVYSKSQAGLTADSKIRRSKIAWLNHLPTIKNDLFDFVTEANRKSFSYDVHKSADIQFTEYHCSEKGHYDWHEDWNQFDGANFERKLSVTVQLSAPDEYEGGEFELHNIDLPDWIKERGSILVFPSFVRHRVKPVTAGVRRSLVAWFEGPRWR